MNSTTKVIKLCSAILVFSAACGEDAGTESPTGSDEAVQAVETVAALTSAGELSQPIDALSPLVRDPFVGVQSGYLRWTPCADLDLEPGQLTVDFGAGCTVRGRFLTGQVEITRTSTTDSATWWVEFGQLGVDGRVLDGTVATSRGDSTVEKSAELSLTEPTGGSSSLSFTGTLVANELGVSIDGEASRTQDTGTSSIDIDQVSVAYGDCYPNQGSVRVQPEEGPSVTVTFSSTTPATGEVQVQFGRFPPTTQVLPACPI